MDAARREAAVVPLHTPAVTEAGWRLFTWERRLALARIALVGVITLLYWRGVAPLAVLLLTVGIGLYPLARLGVHALVRELKVGTEIFVSVATIIAVAGGEYVAAAVLMTIILIAEFVADLNTDRARASIKALIGAAPRTALVRTPAGERTIPIEQLTPGTIVLARAGEKIPVDGTVEAGTAAVNEASISGESIPLEKSAGASVLAGTVVESGAIDINTEKVGPETMFARIVALVEHADSEQAPVQRLADRVASWLVPVVFVFLITVAADIALMTDDLGKIVIARTLARRAYRTIQENLLFGVGVVHILGITAALAGWIGPIQAALLHLGPDVLVFLNSVKLLRVRLERT